VDAMKAAGLAVEYDLVEGADHLFDRETTNEMEGMYKWANKILK